jgi:hypothetical protein
MSTDNTVYWYVVTAKEGLNAWGIPGSETLTYPVLLIVYNNTAIVFDSNRFNEIVQGMLEGLNHLKESNGN